MTFTRLLTTSFPGPLFSEAEKRDPGNEVGSLIFLASRENQDVTSKTRDKGQKATIYHARTVDVVVAILG